MLQEKEVERIGGSEPKRIDFRIVCATNRNLENLIKKNQFRLDLYFRINVIPINLPPLRKMKDDIPLLVKHLLDDLNKDSMKNVTKISREAMTALSNYSWPGNVRELRNSIERALIVCKGNEIELEDLPDMIRGRFDPAMPANGSIPLLKDIIEDAERRVIARALKHTGNNKRKSARLLGINRSGLYNKIKKYGLP